MYRIMGEDQIRDGDPSEPSFSLRPSPESEPLPVPFTPSDGEQPPKPVQDFLLSFTQQLSQLKKQVEAIEARLNQNSSSPSRPPSSNRPYRRIDSKKGQRKAGGQKGNQGHWQAMLEPAPAEPIKPERYSCGNTDFLQISPYHVQQRIELPDIKMKVTP
jgi:hypothetical protein